MDMTKWKITPRVRRTYREGSAWEAMFDVKQKSGWGHDWHFVESFPNREDAQKFINDYKLAEGTLRETPDDLRDEYRKVWQEMGHLATANKILEERIETQAARITALANEVEACKPIPRRTTRRTYR
jgi:hypothetical protein